MARVAAWIERCVSLRKPEVTSAAVMWAACGGGRAVSTFSSSATPPGTGALIISGTHTASPEETAADASSEVSQATTLTLTVN